MSRQFKKGTVYVREPDGTSRVLADGVDVSYACEFDDEHNAITLPENLPAGCSISLPFGWSIAYSYRHETARQRKTREAAEAAAREKQRKNPQTEKEVKKENPVFLLSILTFAIWHALYGPGVTPQDHNR